MTPTQLNLLKQKKLLGILIGAVVLIVAGTMYLGGLNQEEIEVKKEIEKIYDLNDEIKDEEAWYFNESKKIAELNEKVNKINNDSKEGSIAYLKDKLKTAEEENAELAIRLDALEARLDNVGTSTEVYKPQTKEPNDNSSYADIPEFNIDTYKPSAEAAEEYQNLEKTIEVHRFDNPKTGVVKARRNIKTAIPSNSFIKATLLNGVDISASQTSQANPKPIIMNITGWGNLPNNHKIRTLKQCRIHATSWGDLSSERVYMSPDMLTCIDKKGDIIETSVRGYISTRGKAGIRGRLIKRDGELIQQATIAGVLSGLGNSIASSGGTKSISPLGSTTTYDAKDQLKADVGKGMGNALDKIAEYKIRQAEQLQPIIQVDGGIEVEVVFFKTSVLGVVETEAVRHIKDAKNQNQEIYSALNNLNQALETQNE